MTFIVTLIGLLIERFFDWSHLRQWHWYASLQSKVTQKLTGQSSYVILALTLVPLIVIVALIQFILNGWLYGFAKLLFELVIFIYCLGPKDLWADAFSSASPLVVNQNANTASSATSRRHFLDNIFVEANRRIFAVVFWYVVLGPAGAVLYRATTLSSDSDTADAEVTQKAQKLEAALNWLPARIFTFLFALGGHFVQVFSVWRKTILGGLDSNKIILSECGVAALGSDESPKIPADASLEKGSIHLLDRVFAITLALVAVVTLIL